MSEEKKLEKVEKTKEQKEAEALQSRMFILRLMGVDVQLMYNSLASLPANKIMHLLLEINKQIQEQMPKEKEEDKK